MLSVVQPLTLAAVPAVIVPVHVLALLTFQLIENGTPAVGADGVATSVKPLVDVGGLGGAPTTVIANGGLTRLFGVPPGFEQVSCSV